MNFPNLKTNHFVHYYEIQYVKDLVENVLLKLN